MGKIQTFNDGVVDIYSVENIAEPGNMPHEGLISKYIGLRCEERTVGMARFWAANQNNVKIDTLIRVPRLRDVSTQDVAILSIDNKQYKIKQVQYPPDVQPPVMDLSLERLEADYDFS